MPIERRRYVGPYGHKHRTAHVPGVGNLYLNELVEVDREANEVRHVFTGKKLNDLTAEALATLYGDEFVSADTDCTYTLASGAICEKPRVAGTVYCELHGLLARMPKAPTGVIAAPTPLRPLRLETPDVLHGDGFSELHDDEPISTELDGAAVKSVDTARRMPNLTIRHICRFCHDDFTSSDELDDLCPTCLALMPVDDGVPSPSDSPQTPPPSGSEDPALDAEPQSIRYGTGRSTLRKKPPDATISDQ